AFQGAVLARQLDGLALAQLRLAGAFGGLGLHREAEGCIADAALWAAWTSMQHRVPRLARGLGMARVLCSGGPEALEARRRLEQAGVLVDEQGGVKFTPGARVEYASGPWVRGLAVNDLGALKRLPEASLPAAAPGGLPARAPRRYASRIFRHLDALEATRLWRALSVERQDPLSAGVLGAGALWSQHAVRECDWFPTSYFRAAVMRRLGALSAPPGSACRMPRRAGNDSGEVDMERTVPELARTSEAGAVVEAVMDLVFTFPGSVQPEAAEAATIDKRAQDGADVLTVAFETYGRLGAGTHSALEHLASQAGAWLWDQWAVPRLVPTWRAALERIVLFAAADTDLFALGCAPTAAEARAAWGRVFGGGGDAGTGG
ncbi:unnamed protein product, partial [Prorocentrum cordatum]